METVPCDGCRKPLMKARYSDSAWKKYKERKARNQSAKLPRCLNCNPQNRQEMVCTKCNKTKDLDHFSKQQRRQTDVAECKDCVQMREDRLTNHEEAVEEEEIIEEIKQEEMRTYYPSTASRLHSTVPSRVSARSQSERYETETNPRSESSWVQGNDAISVGASQYSGTGTIASRRQNTGTEWDQYPGDGRVRGSASLSARDRFAKQNAVPKPLAQRVQEQIQRDRNNDRLEVDELHRADSDDGSDDDEDPY